jgi:hypothetical protein
MCVTKSDISFLTPLTQRAGILVAVISGGRPELKQRPTHKFLPRLHDAGVHDIVWVVSDRDAPRYEQDGHQMVVYSREWAESYAATHWLLPGQPEPGGFLGAFPGREYACREAERRGCWAVMQLDDNIVRLAFPRGAAASFEIGRRMGQLAGFLDLITAVTLSTNGRMVGGNLDAIPYVRLQVARAGFTYSLFLERVGAGREEWYGPFEDDICHQFAYGTRSDGATSIVLPLLRYMKTGVREKATGMRAAYDHTRSVQLQRIFPESAKVGIRAKHSNGKGEARVFHTMLPGAIRNPMVVTDEELFLNVKTRMEDLLIEWRRESDVMTRAKIQARSQGKGHQRFVSSQFTGERSKPA